MSAILAKLGLSTLQKRLQGKKTYIGLIGAILLVVLEFFGVKVPTEAYRVVALIGGGGLVAKVDRDMR